MTTATTTNYPDVRDGLTILERLTVRAVASAKGDEQTRSSRIVAGATRREPNFSAGELYGALVHLAQSWVTSYPLVEGHGDFGSPEGSPAAGSVVTHASLAPAGQALVDELDLPEDDPGQRLHMKAATQILPGPFPSLLANGSSSADATFLPHLVGEVAQAITARLQDPTTSLTAIRALIPGPEFPTACTIVNASALDAIYETGHGELRVRRDDTGEETTIVVNATAIVDGQPKRIGLLDQIDEYIEHRRSVLRRKHRSKHEQALDKIIAHDLSEISERFATDRRTQIVPEPA